MTSLKRINAILDGVSMMMHGRSSLESDERVSLDKLRYKQADGLSAVSVSMSKIARPIMAKSMRDVREAKKKQLKATSR